MLLNILSSDDIDSYRRPSCGRGLMRPPVALKQKERNFEEWLIEACETQRM